MMCIITNANNDDENSYSVATLEPLHVDPGELPSVWQAVMGSGIERRRAELEHLQYVCRYKSRIITIL